MSAIENFAALPVKEQREFAAALLKTINSEKTFHDDTTFEIINVEADDLTGGLMIEVSHTDFIVVDREANWTCAYEDEAEHDPGFDANYENSIYDDAKKAFKTLSTVIDGYKVSLEVSDVDADETVEVEVDRISHEDGGIGGYEYFGHSGHDSQPYVEVEGIIAKACDCGLAFFVEPDDAFEDVAEESEEN